MSEVELICKLEAELEEANRQITAYQIAKDNLELRLEKATQGYSPHESAPHLEPAQVY